MANYRVLDPKGDVVATEDFAGAEKAHAWFIDKKADNSALGWRLEVDHDGEWAFVDDTDGVDK